GVREIAAGNYHTCALTVVGGVKCWGFNRYGQLGDGTHKRRLTPVGVSHLASGVSDLVAGGFHTCAVTDGGDMRCWGWNGEGELGDGTTISRHNPTEV